jgi:hypothetical protein
VKRYRARILAAIAAIGVLVGCGPGRPAGTGDAEQGYPP